ncbi:MAG: hypothetical protein GXP26_08175 [Planctomycetes bacterium]|nr:hypothetical protein [Planctomycetota bacterium]
MDPTDFAVAREVEAEIFGAFWYPGVCFTGFRWLVKLSLTLASYGNPLADTRDGVN